VRKPHVHAELRGAIARESEQGAPRDAAEPVPARRDRHALHVDVDVVPVGEVVRDRLKRLGIGLTKILHRLVGEHDAPAERVVDGVALDDRDLVGRVRLLHEEGEVESRRSSANHDDLQMTSHHRVNADQSAF
jgi:hypothetical protein